MGHHLKSKGLIPNGNRPLIFVGVAGFEPTTPCSQSRCAYAIIYIAKQTIYKAISLRLLPR